MKKAERRDADRPVSPSKRDEDRGDGWHRRVAPTNGRQVGETRPQALEDERERAGKETRAARCRIGDPGDERRISQVCPPCYPVNRLRRVRSRTPADPVGPADRERDRAGTLPMLGALHQHQERGEDEDRQEGRPLPVSTVLPAGRAAGPFGIAERVAQLRQVWSWGPLLAPADGPSGSGRPHPPAVLRGRGIVPRGGPLGEGRRCAVVDGPDETPVSPAPPKDQDPDDEHRQRPPNPAPDVRTAVSSRSTAGGQDHGRRKRGDQHELPGPVSQRVAAATTRGRPPAEDQGPRWPQKTRRYRSGR